MSNQTPISHPEYNARGNGGLNILEITERQKQLLKHLRKIDKETLSQLVIINMTAREQEIYHRLLVDTGLISS